MNECRFRSNYGNRPPVTPERPSGPSKVDVIGYQPFQKRIEVILQTGANIQALQAQGYEYSDKDLPDDFQPHPILSEKLDAFHHAIPARRIMEQGKEAAKKLKAAKVVKTEVASDKVVSSNEAPFAPPPNKV